MTMLPDIGGFARRLEEGQVELMMRLDRIIELLEALQDQEGAVLHSVRTPEAEAGTG